MSKNVAPYLSRISIHKGIPDVVDWCFHQYTCAVPTFVKFIFEEGTCCVQHEPIKKNIFPGGLCVHRPYTFDLLGHLEETYVQANLASKNLKTNKNISDIIGPSCTNHLHI